MIINLIPDLLIGAAGGLLDGHLRQKPLIESTMTGVAIKVTQVFASLAVGMLGLLSANGSAEGNWKPIVVLSILGMLAVRIGIVYASLHYGYIGEAVALSFIAIDTIGVLTSL